MSKKLKSYSETTQLNFNSSSGKKQKLFLMENYFVILLSRQIFYLITRLKIKTMSGFIEKYPRV